MAATTALAAGLTLAIGRVIIALLQSWQLSVGSVEWYIGFASPEPVLFGTDPVLRAVIAILPFTVGYFLALWVVAPITEQLGIGHVVTRAVLATGIGATLWFVVLGLTGVVTAVSATSDVLGIAASPGLIGAQLGYALQQALTGLVVLLPLGVLGGVLQWVWRTAHPAPHHIEGLIDV